MNVKRIVIASVLKTVDDTRMYEKFGISIGKSNKYEVNIIGFFSKNQKQHKNINFYPIFSFSRVSLKRFLAPFKYFKYLIKIHPSLIIITTYELIFSTIIYKWLFKTRVIYDVRENYKKNLNTNLGSNMGLKNLWIWYISITEYWAGIFFDWFFLAEKGYDTELTFHKKKYHIIENKAIHTDLKATTKKTTYSYRFIYSGTITKIYGIYQTLEVFAAIRTALPGATLTIIGHFPYRSDLVAIKKIASSDAGIKVVGGLTPVPHSLILKAIQKADFGFISHQPVESIKNCFPTRIYEYMAHGMPFLLQNHPLWVDYCALWDCAIILDFNKFDAVEIIEQVTDRKFYKNGIPKTVFWNTEEEMLLKVVDQLLIH